jgi:predicted Zn-dependent peptidase
MKSDFRRIQPEIRQVDPGTLPVAGKFILDNNIPVYTIEAGSEDLMKLDFIFDAGQVSEKAPLISSSTNMMLPEGTRNYNAEKLNTTLDFYGTFLGQHADKDNAGISILFITRHLAKIIELCSEIIKYPVFPEEEIDALMKKRLQWFMLGQEKVQVIASDLFFEAVFGKNHPYGIRVMPEDFNRINRKLLVDFHSEYYSSKKMTIIASGKIPAETKPLLNKYFGKEHGTDSVGTNNKTIPSGEKLRKIRIPKKSAVQSAIRIGSATINKRDPDYPGLKVVDTILGGFFGSRLMKNIREDKGFTYGINSSVISYNLSGYQMIATEVGKGYTNRTIEEIYNEITSLQKHPVEKNELNVVKNFMLGEMLRMFDGPFALAESFKAAWEFGLDNSYYYRLAEKIKTIEPDEILHIANTYYNIDQMYEIVVGPE